MCIRDRTNKQQNVNKFVLTCTYRYLELDSKADNYDTTVWLDTQAHSRKKTSSVISIYSKFFCTCLKEHKRPDRNQTAVVFSVS